MIRAKETDVLVIAVAIFSQLQELGLQEMWLAFGQGRNLKWISMHELTTTLAPDKTLVFCFSMPLQAVILWLHSVERAKGQNGGHGMCVLKLQMSSPNWAAILHTLKKRILGGWKSLLSWCMTDPVQLELLMMHGWSSFPGSKYHTKLFPELVHPLFSTLDVLHTSQHAYRAELWSVSLKRRILENGGGNQKKTAGVSYGLSSYQLLRVAKSLPNASANAVS